jgi:hypothetical protein
MSHSNLVIQQYRDLHSKQILLPFSFVVRQGIREWWGLSPEQQLLPESIGFGTDVSVQTAAPLSPTTVSDKVQEYHTTVFFDIQGPLPTSQQIRSQRVDDDVPTTSELSHLYRGVETSVQLNQHVVTVPKLPIRSRSPLSQEQSRTKLSGQVYQRNDIGGIIDAVGTKTDDISRSRAKTPIRLYRSRHRATSWCNNESVLQVRSNSPLPVSDYACDLRSPPSFDA